MILLIGASGHLGRAVAQHLLEQGKPVRLMTRNPLNVLHLEQQGAEVVKGDLRNIASLKSACQGVEQILAAAHALNGKGDNNIHTVDEVGNRNLIDAAKAAGVKHFIFVSVQGASSDSELEFFRIKYRVEEYLRASGMSYTIIRPCAFMDLWGELVGSPILKQGTATIFGSGSNPINFVSADDTAQVVCASLDEPATFDRILEVCGPEDLTMNQVVDIFDRLSSRSTKKRYMPLPVMKGMSLFMRLFNPTLSRLIQMSVYMDTADLCCGMTETERELPFPLTHFEDWARRNYGGQQESNRYSL